MGWMLFLKSLHILAAVTAVGSNLTYGIWAALGRRDEAHLGFALRGIAFVDRRLANPAYGVLLVTGLLMAFIYFSITLTWIITGLAIYIAAAVLGAAVYGPLVQRQIAALDSEGPSGETYRALERRGTMIGMLLGVLVIGAVFVMVFKPIA